LNDNLWFAHDSSPRFVRFEKVCTDLGWGPEKEIACGDRVGYTSCCNIQTFASPRNIKT
jgi:hypothetical protein